MGAIEPTLEWHKSLLQPDINHCVILSKLRCIVTLVSLVLLMTDIPRTGLGVRNLYTFYPVPLMPSTAVRFGPFNYPVLQISRQNESNEAPSEFVGLKGKQSIATARVWSYQYDTTSVGLRGAVELLNVTEFPSFLLYKPQAGERTNVTSLLDLGTVFTMLDAFISASQRCLVRPEKNWPTMLRYATKHNWVDRLHHYVVSFASKNSAWRLHSLHSPRISLEPLSLSICSNGVKRSPPRPRFCNHPGIWKCSNPLDASLPPVRLWDHMDLRLQSLQRQYPDLKLEVALVSSQRLSSTSGAMRSTFYNYEALEIVVLTRGRRCTGSSCTTVFVDDYRYERDIVQTNLVDWYGIISTLRGAAQAYVWIRVLLLGYGAYMYAAAEQTQSSSRWRLAVSMVFKIPFQVVVYSSLLPVCAYVGALLLDSSFTDIFLDSYWASVGGAVNFQWLPFIQTTSVQMRGVWSLALFATVVLFAMRLRHQDGIPGVRGLLISFTSSLTVFGPYKSVFYRDMNIVKVFRIPGEGPTMDIVQSSNPGDCFNSSSYFYGGTSKTVRLCLVAVALVTITVKCLGFFTPRASWTYRATRGIICRQSPAPCGIERLWRTTSPVIHFQAPTHRQIPTLSSSMSSSAARVAPSPLPNVRGLSGSEFTVGPSSSGWHPWRLWSRKTSSVERKQPETGAFTSRTVESHSVLTLVNIAMMTDPWNFFWLRVVGIQLYLYRIRVHNDRSLTPYAVILPYAEDELEDRTGLSCEVFELLDSASSRDVSMCVLLQSG
ncbi:hypothetical protein V7S43_012221 [Phytophthora oleae]|uniref:Transmembrane protein n=1 Tax=Phytophthora oleae TaxID=2107226 RepID=A0ABD3F7H0_9STRA